MQGASVLPEEFRQQQRIQQQQRARQVRGIAGSRRIGYVGGQRLKLLRKWELSDRGETPKERLNVAAGFNYEVDILASL